MFVEDVADRCKIRTLGDRGDDIAVVVKDGEPGPQSVRSPHDIIGLDFVTLQFLDDVRSQSRIIDDTDVGRTKFQIGDILHDIAAHTAVDLNDAADVSSRRDELIDRITFDINEYCPKYDDPHYLSPVLLLQ